MTAHDVRFLTVCRHCKGLGDERTMVHFMHGRCFIKARGMKALLALPESAIANLTLDDIGVEAMRALLRK